MALDGAALPGNPPRLLQASHCVHRRVERPAGDRSARKAEALQRYRNVIRQLADREQCTKVVGQRVKAARMHDSSAAVLRRDVVAQVHQVDELRLAGEVDVVGAGGRAGSHQRLAVSDVGPDGRDHDPRGLRQCPDRVRVVDIGDHQPEVGALQPLPECFELVGVASGDRRNVPRPAYCRPDTQRSAHRRSRSPRTARCHRYAPPLATLPGSLNFPVQC